MPTDRYKPLLDRDFLRAELHYDYQDYLAGGHDDALKSRLAAWSAREVKRETQAEGAFVQRFFVETWGYTADGGGGDGYNLHPKFAIAGAGQTGARGEADLAIGAFGGGRPAIPQVVCEFKDVHSGLDKPQNRKGNNRSPVMQARDYLFFARNAYVGGAIEPRFAIVTDMDEFRLYFWAHFPDRYMRFAITGAGDLFHQVHPLLGDGEAAQFERFLFWRLFRPDMLLSEAGRTQLERRIAKQGKIEERLEGDFYAEYRAYRQVLIDNIMVQRPEGVTRSGAVRLGQKLLDRLIFVMFAEDMGGRVGFPPGELVAQLRRFSEDGFLLPEGGEIWQRLKLIFQWMNTGGRLGDHDIHRFNGGLFADDPALDALTLPNRLFVRRGQAQTEPNAAEYKATLYYLASKYNFAREGDARNSIGLYTLGHIFEQSIVELEKLEADAEHRPSLTDITKRKRDGVYYTPEWVVQRIVEEVIDPLLAGWKAESGWSREGEPAAAAVGAYWDRLRKIRVIDPACGSGAFLIVALRHLEREFAAAADAAYAAKAIDQRPTADAITEMILTENLWGVDINPASVEITKLSLWLHTARPNRPLSGLDRTIRCGNSLVDKRFYNKRTLDDAEERDRINTFDWEGDFALESFDAVIGNPPYVKLQNFVKVNADMAAWLVSGSSGEAPYRSTGTGNFDLYLPFIEKGLALLNPGGRMGYIAPNLWPTLEYGEGLRGLVAEGRHLEKWIDFRSHQIFEEATVYTAIQIFSKAPVTRIALAFVGDGDLSRVDWHDPDNRLDYADIKHPHKPWLIAPAPVRALIERLGREAPRLDDPHVSNGIIVGIQTSADHIYHLTRPRAGRYVYTPRGKGAAAIEVAIEDALMKPLVSGAEVKRFIEPRTDTYLLFPYRIDVKGAALIPPDEMARDYPKAWAYLRSHEAELRAREGGKFDDDAWYRMGRHQNLDKQELPKLLVAQLVPALRLSFDERGKVYANNVRVNGILPRGDNGWFLLAVLNAPVTNAIFRWLGKPKDNGYFEANKQFIAPLPIPRADRADRASLSGLARRMQGNRTRQMDLRAALTERLATTTRVTLSYDRFLPGVRSIAAIEADAPATIAPADRKNWVDEQRASDEEAALAQLDAAIRADSLFDVTLADGKLSLAVDEREAARLFVGDEEGPLIAAQWRAVALGFEPRGKGDGKRLADQLRRVAREAEPAVRDQILDIASELATLDAVLRDDEGDLHELTCRVFKLSEAERRLVEEGR